MIKVLYITDSLRQRFGVTAVIMNYIEHFPKGRISIDLLVYTDSEKDQIEKAKELGVTVFFMPKLGIKSIVKYKDFLESFFKNHQYDIIHSHFNQIDGIVFPIARKNGVKCCISHSHNTRLSDNKIKAIRNRLLCWNIGHNADYMAACSEQAGIALYGSQFKNSNNKIIIKNGIDVQKYAFNIHNRLAVRSEFKIGADEILIGQVGSFKPQKNYPFTVDMFAALCEKGKKYKLLLIGDGETKEYIQNRVKKYGITDKVIFAGVRPDVNRILSGLDFFILPSLFEGLGIALIEAQSSGLICFASDEIPLEAKVTSNIIFLPINKGVNIWIQKITDTVPIDNVQRDKYMAVVSEKGYDIFKEAVKLENFYVTVSKNII